MGIPSIAIQSSQAAIDLILSEEVSDQPYYTRHFTHFEWPQGASGPTVAIGYDCGYVSPDEIKADWIGYVDDATVSGLMKAAGLRGPQAQAWVRAHGSSVTITWDQALKQFMGNELVQWEAKVRKDLQNTSELSGDSFGALTSLAYNRGDGGFHAPGARFLEMRAIADHMAAKAFDRIPQEFLSMRRLWPAGGDLWKRRLHEAKLFAQGLVAAPAVA